MNRREFFLFQRNKCIRCTALLSTQVTADDICSYVQDRQVSTETCSIFTKISAVCRLCKNSIAAWYIGVINHRFQTRLRRITQGPSWNYYCDSIYYTFVPSLLYFTSVHFGKLCSNFCHFGTLCGTTRIILNSLSVTLIGSSLT